MARATSTAPLSKKAYDTQASRLREQLIQLQVALKDAPFPVLLILAGVEGAGRSELINTLSAWLDPRGLEVVSHHQPTDEERERPPLWRYWRTLPPRGRIALYADSWYHDLFSETALGKKIATPLPAACARAAHFEKLLSDDGALILKIWLHLDPAQQRHRLQTLSRDPRTAWRITPDHWRHHRLYAPLAQLSQRVRKLTTQPRLAWHTIDASDERARNLAVARLLLSQFRAHHRRQLALVAQPAPKPAAPKAIKPAGLRRLRALPLDQHLSSSAYETSREKWLGNLSQAIRSARAAGRSVLFVFEGWDAAGKGGAIRRLTSALDARDYRVIPVGKPSDEEKAHHYLWRFWRHLPRAGGVTIYDRSWYGRLLVERLEGFARPAEWRRAFAEINDFEQQLAARGIIVVKFWLHISKAEQLRRFREREAVAYKRHKLNAEDWRNRGKWSAYEIAVGDMLALTETKAAPWHLIPADNKRHARLEVLKTACRQVAHALAHR